MGSSEKEIRKISSLGFHKQLNVVGLEIMVLFFCCCCYLALSK